MEQFTASEVRDRKRFEEWYATHSFNYSRDPIGSRDCSLQWEAWKAARADLLEAREKAVPVAWRSLSLPTTFICDAPKNLDCEKWQPLYTHPDPSDAERLAEALRAIRQRVTENSSALARFIIATCDEALAAHSAQAQPHTVHPEHSCEECGGQNVTWFAPSELWNEVVRSPDGREPMLCPMCFIKRAEKAGHSKDAWSVRPEFYEESAQPPAARVTDAMVGRAQDCLHDKGKDIGYYHMRAALEAALAAQESPNGV